MLGERIKRARKAAGLSLAALGELVGLSKMTLSKFENDKQTPSSTQLISLARALSVRVEYFFRGPQTVKVSQLEYRKRSDTPQKLIEKIHADVLDQAERWQVLLGFYPSSPIQNFKLPQGLPEHIHDYAQIEAVAEQMRDTWMLGRNPIPDLTNTLETHGILVILTEHGEYKFDGLAAQIEQKPVIGVCTAWPGDRLRFTLAHELGHLVLHERLSAELDEEKACHRFAGAFLFPKKAVIETFGQHRNELEAQELYIQKHEYGISMAACLYRLHHCQVISDALFTSWQAIFSKHGWWKQEPGDAYPTEKTMLFTQLVYRALAEDYISEAKAAELLNMSLMVFHQQRKLEAVHADINQ